MINAVGIDSHTAAELTYPALVVEKHLEALLAGEKPMPPSSAIWALEAFLRNATETERRQLDPVASAVSYELADSALRATSPSVSDTDSVLKSFLELLEDLESTNRLVRPSRSVAKGLLEFLASLRLRGQGESYNRFQSCI